MFKGKYSWIAEAFGGALLFLLPLKFGTLVSVPAITMIYWTEPVSLFIASWPFPVFPVFSAIFLLTTLALVPFNTGSGKSRYFAAMWGLLALVSVCGCFSAGNPPDAALYFLNHSISVGAYLIGFQRIISSNKKIVPVYYGVFTAAFLCSLLVGLNQYFSGYRDTIDQLQQRNMGEVDGKIMFRLQQMRVTGGFSACNAFAGYLILGLPPVLAFLWNAGSKFAPAAVSRILFTVPVLGTGLFLLWKTGSRGGILSLTAGIFLVFFAAKMRKQIRLALFSLIPLAAAGITALILLGRGGKSILFRLDYIQGAFRMMLDSPFTGTGWGGFQRQFMKLKWIMDPEAPASPHNFPLSLGAQTGIAGFLLASLILLTAFWFLFRSQSGKTLRENFSAEHLLLTGSFCGIMCWELHSLQEILYETPGAVVSFGALVLMAFALAEPKKTELVSEKKGSGFKPAWNTGILLYGIAALYPAWKTISFDSSLAALNDMTDFRMLSREQLALVKFSDAADAFEQAKKKKPDSPYPYLSISDFLAARGEHDSAVEMTKKAVELDPYNAGFRLRLYRMLKQQGYGEAALIQLKKAAELFPMNPEYQELIQQEIQ